MLVKTLRGADLLFGARFFSYRDIKGLLCKINHGGIGMGTVIPAGQTYPYDSIDNAISLKNLQPSPLGSKGLCLSGFQKVKVVEKTITQPSPLIPLGFIDSYKHHLVLSIQNGIEVKVGEGSSSNLHLAKPL